MVGLDTRFQVLAAPGLVNSDEQGERLALDPSVRKLMLGLGADRGLHGVGLFFAEGDELISRTPIRTLDDLKGKKVRIFASPFQTVAFQRLGMTPVALTLGDVVPGLQEGTIDSAVTGIGPIVSFHMVDAAKYVTAIHQPAIFLITEVNKKWFDSLPKNLQELIESAAIKADHDINPIAVKMVDEALQKWKSVGGTLFAFSADDRAKLSKLLGDVGTEVASKNPQLAAAYKTVTDAAHALSAAK
jgi:TRAP-type C4-dicarboxylate transport system substrate-binding protein